MSASATQRILRAVGALLAVALLVFTLRSAWREFSADPVPFSSVRAAISIPVLGLTYVWFAWLWARLARELGARVRLGEAIQVWSFSNLGRYLPGKIWQLVGLVVVARDFGVPAAAATTVAVLSMVYMVSAGALVGAVLTPDAVRGFGPAGVLVLVAAACLFIPIIRPSLLSGLLRRLPKVLRVTDAPEFARRSMIEFAGYFCVVWLAHGAAFWIFASAFGDIGWRSIPSFIGAYSLSYVTGLAALFAPGGIGVREGVLGYAVDLITTDGFPAHVVAVAARIWTITAEVTVLLLALGLRLRSRGGLA